MWRQMFATDVAICWISEEPCIKARAVKHGLQKFCLTSWQSSSYRWTASPEGGTTASSSHGEPSIWPHCEIHFEMLNKCPSRLQTGDICKHRHASMTCLQVDHSKGDQNRRHPNCLSEMSCIFDSLLFANSGVWCECEWWYFIYCHHSSSRMALGVPKGNSRGAMSWPKLCQTSSIFTKQVAAWTCCARDITCNSPWLILVCPMGAQ